MAWDDKIIYYIYMYREGRVVGGGGGRWTGRGRGERSREKVPDETMKKITSDYCLI